MTQSDALSQGMTQLKTDLDSVAVAIATEIQQLRDAIALDADLRVAADAAIAGLSAAHDQLSGMASQLAADDPTPPAP